MILLLKGRKPSPEGSIKKYPSGLIYKKVGKKWAYLGKIGQGKVDKEVEEAKRLGIFLESKIESKEKSETVVEKKGDVERFGLAKKFERKVIIESNMRSLDYYIKRIRQSSEASDSPLHDYENKTNKETLGVLEKYGIRSVKDLLKIYKAKDWDKWRELETELGIRAGMAYGVALSMRFLSNLELWHWRISPKSKTLQMSDEYGIKFDDAGNMLCIMNVEVKQKFGKQDMQFPRFVPYADVLDFIMLYGPKNEQVRTKVLERVRDSLNRGVVIKKRNADLASVFDEFEQATGMQINLDATTDKGLKLEKSLVQQALSVIKKVATYFNPAVYTGPKGEKLKLGFTNSCVEAAAYYQPLSKTVYLSPGYVGTFGHEAAHFLWDTSTEEFKNEFKAWSDKVGYTKNIEDHVAEKNREMSDEDLMVAIKGLVVSNQENLTELAKENQDVADAVGYLIKQVVASRDWKSLHSSNILYNVKDLQVGLFKYGVGFRPSNSEYEESLKKKTEAYLKGKFGYVESVESVNKDWIPDVDYMQKAIKTVSEYIYGSAGDSSKEYEKKKTLLDKASSTFFKGLEDIADKRRDKKNWFSTNPKYWLNPNEMFARALEEHIVHSEKRRLGVTSESYTTGSGLTITHIKGQQPTTKIATPAVIERGGQSWLGYGWGEVDPSDEMFDANDGEFKKILQKHFGNEEIKAIGRMHMVLLLKGRKPSPEGQTKKYPGGLIYRKEGKKWVYFGKVGQPKADAAVEEAKQKGLFVEAEEKQAVEKKKPDATGKQKTSSHIKAKKKMVSGLKPGTVVEIKGMKKEATIIKKHHGGLITIRYGKKTINTKQIKASKVVRVVSNDDPENVDKSIKGADPDTRAAKVAEINGVSLEVKKPDPYDFVPSQRTYQLPYGNKEIAVIDYAAAIPNKVILIPQKYIPEMEKPAFIPTIDVESFQKKFLGRVEGVKLPDGSGYLIRLGSSSKPGSSTSYGEVQIPQFAIVSAEVLIATQDYYAKLSKIALAKEKEKYLQGWIVKRQSDITQYMGYLNKPDLPENKKQYYASRIKELQMYIKGVETGDKKLLKEALKYGPKSRRVGDNKMTYGHGDLIKAVYGGQIWTYHREYIADLNQKALDMEAQYLDDLGVYHKGEETSYGDSGTKPNLLNTHGVLVKRQNGDEITGKEVKQIRGALDEVYSVFGSKKEMSKNWGLKISHAGAKMMHARKAIGLFFPHYRAIGVSFGEKGAGAFTMSHEFAHFMDHYVGAKAGRHYVSDDWGTTAGKIAQLTRKHTKIKGDYWKRTCECFARGLESYFIYKTQGKEAINSVHPGAMVVGDDVEKELVPLVEQFFKENIEVLKSINITLVLGKSKLLMVLRKKGKAKHKPDSAYDKKQLAMGVEVEKEHISDPEVAKEIAKDHLEEFSNYYIALKEMEDELKSEEKQTVKPTLDAVIKFFKDNPNPDDDKLHAWAKKNNYVNHLVENIAYRLATKAAKKFGKAKPYPEGTVRNWKGGKYQKKGGVWLPISEGKVVEKKKDGDKKNVVVKKLDGSKEILGVMKKVRTKKIYMDDVDGKDKKIFNTLTKEGIISWKHVGSNEFVCCLTDKGKIELDHAEAVQRKVTREKERNGK